jgi:hypothetical protein
MTTEQIIIYLSIYSLVVIFVVARIMRFNLERKRELLLLEKLPPQEAADFLRKIKKSRKRYFLIGTVILLLCSFVIAPKIYQAKVQAAKKLHSQNDARYLYKAVWMYSSENNGKAPPSLKDPRFLKFLKPPAKEHAFSNFEIFPFSEVLAMTPNPSKKIMIYSKNPDEKGQRLIIFADGHSEYSISESNFQKMLSDQLSSQKQK